MTIRGHMCAWTRWMTGLGLLAMVAGCRSRAELPAPSYPRVSAPDAPFRQRRPAPLPDMPSETWAGEVSSFKLENGLTVWTLQRPGSPSAFVGVVLPKAGTLTGADPSELLALTGRMVAEGGTRWPDGRVVNRMTINGYAPRMIHRPTHMAFTLPVMDAALPAAVDMLGRVVRAPAFPADALDGVRLDALLALRNRSAGLAFLMRKMALDAAYGEELSRRLLVSDEGALREHDLAAVKACYQRAFRPQDAILVVAGGVDAAQVRRAAEAAFGDWRAAPEGASTPARKALSTRSRGRHVRLLWNGEGAQAEVALSQPAPALGDDDADLAFALLSEIAVGSFVSRADMRLRHEQGMTYGIRPSLIQTPQLGLLEISAAVETERVSAAVSDLLSLLHELQQREVSADELASAKTAYRGYLAGELNSNAGLFQLAIEAAAAGKDPHWLTSLDARLAEITPRDVLDVARTYLRPDDVEIVIVGDNEAARRARVLGPVTTYVAKTGL